MRLAASRLFASSRQSFTSSRRVSPELCILVLPSFVRGRREDRVPAGTRGPLCEKLRYKRLHSGIQVKPETTRPSLRSGLTAYAELSPGSDALLPPSPCRWLMRKPGWAARITARLDAQAPGVRTTRFCRTLTAPVVRATPSLTVARPAISVAPMQSASTTAHPTFVTIAIRPSDRGEVTRMYRKSEFR